jgi:plastocyanin
MMTPRILFLAALACATVTDAATITIQAMDVMYMPAKVTAVPGDILEYHFMAHNHSVVMGDFSSPCMPGAGHKGFSSGFWPTSTSGENVRGASSANLAEASS